MKGQQNLHCKEDWIPCPREFKIVEGITAASTGHGHHPSLHTHTHTQGTSGCDVLLTFSEANFQ